MTQGRGRIRIGISGWRYAPWRGVFFPDDLLQAHELSFAARCFSTIEINGSFYSLQHPDSWRRWYEATPAGFVFSVKGPRYLTHMLRLRKFENPLANFFASGILGLREKLSVVLWQFPPNFQYQAERLQPFLAALPRNTRSALKLARRRDRRMHGRSVLSIDANRRLRHAIEIRHPSFETPEFFALLRRHNVALVVADAAGKWPLLMQDTADFHYVRLHGDEHLYVSGYSDAALRTWARRIRKWQAPGDVYCYFDNDAKVHAPFDALVLANMLRRRLGNAVLGQPPAECLSSRRPER